MSKKIKETELLVPPLMEIELNNIGGVLQSGTLLKIDGTYFVRKEPQSTMASEITILTKMYSPIPPYLYSFKFTGKEVEIEIVGDEKIDRKDVKVETITPEDVAEAKAIAKGENIKKEAIKEHDLKDLKAKVEKAKQEKAKLEEQKDKVADEKVAESVVEEEVAPEDLPFPEAERERLERVKAEKEQAKEETQVEDEPVVDLFADD
jgi:hypothetical protein